MKKTLALLLAAVMLLSVLAACSSKAETPAEPEQTTEEPAAETPAEPEQTTEETTAAEEPSQEELDQAAADEVAAMIDAIYVQTRTNETDAQCEAAKAAWDALTDAQKALVEGDEASPDYFGLDTGDASKISARMSCWSSRSARLSMTAASPTSRASKTRCRKRTPTGRSAALSLHRSSSTTFRLVTARRSTT